MSAGEVTFNDAYTFPSADGTADQVLVTDGAGNLSWDDQSGGAEAIDDLTDGKTSGSSIFLGEGAGSSDDGGNSNTAVGLNALNSNFDGQWNVAFGAYASSSSTGSYNASFGYQALYNNVTGAYNTAIGNATLINNTNSYNVAVGYRALYENVGGQGNNALGFEALDANTSGLYNIGIGWRAGDNITTGSRNIIIGYDIDAENATGSDQLNIGDLITGDMAAGEVTFNDAYTFPAADGTTDQILQTDGSGSVSWVDASAAGGGAFETTSNVTSNSPGDMAADDFVFGSDQIDNAFGTDDDNRFYFDKSKGSFRAGRATSTQWDAANTGDYTTAFGQDNIVTGNRGFIGGGNDNEIASGVASFIGGGSSNLMDNGADESVIGGGYDNEIDQSDRCVIAGGYQNAIDNVSYYSAISGGRENTISLGEWSSISGGYLNTMAFDEDYCVISGGRNNEIDGHLSAIAGGAYLKVGGGSFGFRGQLGSPSTQIDLSGSSNAFIVENASFMFNSDQNRSDADFHVAGSSDNLIYADASESRVGINTSTPSATLHVDGTLRVGEYTLPETDGSADQVLVTDGSGVLSWDDQAGGAEEIDDLTDGKTDNTSVFLGENAGASDDGTDNENTAVGIDALNANTSGYENVALGYKALEDNTSGSWNLAFGNNALSSNTSGEGNVAVGPSALNSQSDANYNTAVGFAAMNFSSGGNSNTAVGCYAMRNNTSGNYNSVYGHQALLDNTTGSNNATYGYQSMENNTTGQSNAAYGHMAMRANTTGRNNTAIGYSAGYSNETGNDNVLLGYGAGYYETGSDKLYITNEAGADIDDGRDKAMFYGDFSADELTVNASTTITSTLTIDDGAEAYTFPTADGAADQVMVTDGSGSLSWDDAVDVFSGLWTDETSPANHIKIATEEKGIACYDATLYGTNANTHVNLGYGSGAFSSISGASGQNYSYITISGGYFNIAEEDYATIGGGYSNEATGETSTIAGGYNNETSDRYATVAGGRTNQASGLRSFIGGGEDNIASGNTGTIGGGLGNQATNWLTTVSGGEDNRATGNRSTIGGGESNRASGENSTVSGGYENTASGDNSTVSGGYSNTASGSRSIICGGLGNEATNEYSTICGGWDNTSSGSRAFIGGGYGNSASESFSSIAGGYGNDATQDYSTIAGGHNNTADGYLSSIVAGEENTATGLGSFVGGGKNNVAYGNYSVIPGGSYLKVGTRSYGFRGGIGDYPSTETDVSSEDETFHIVDAHFFFNYNNANADFRVDGSSDHLIFADASESRVGINTSTPSATLHVDGTLRVGAYTLPETDGDADQVLVTDGSGVLSWDDQAGGGDDDWSEETSPADHLAAKAGGIASNDAVLYGTGAETHLNLGFNSSETGESGQNYSYVTVVGGNQNVAKKTGAFVGGGANNHANGEYSIAMGSANYAEADYSAALNGSGNVNKAVYSVITGGINNYIDTDASGGSMFIGGGNSNVIGADANYSAIVGGDRDTISQNSEYAFIGGGTGNWIDANSDYTVISGGSNNTIESTSHYSFIGSGYTNTLESGSDNSVLVGGYNNTLTGNYSALAGGINNSLDGNNSFIGSGYQDTLSGASSAIAGGYFCKITNNYAFIGAGNRNTVSGSSSVVAGGLSNEASGAYSAIPGGAYLKVGAGSFGFRGRIGDPSPPSTVEDVSSETNTFHILNANFHFNKNNMDADFRINGENINNLFFVEASSDLIGIGLNNPAHKLDISVTSDDDNAVRGLNIEISDDDHTANAIRATTDAEAAAIYADNIDDDGTNDVNALEIADGGGRIKMSYASGEGPVPRDVSVYRFTSDTDLSIDGGEEGQVVYVINNTGSPIDIYSHSIVNNRCGIFMYDGTEWRMLDLD